MGLTQDKFIARLKRQKDVSIDRHILSHIENGKAYKKKNPYLLTEDQIIAISQLRKETPTSIIFGSEPEKEKTVKLLLMAIILNGAEYQEEGKSVQSLYHPFINTKITKKERAKFVDAGCEKNKGTIEEEVTRRELEELSTLKLKEFVSYCRYFINDNSADRLLFLDMIHHSDLVTEIRDEELENYIKWFENNYAFFSSEKNLKDFNRLVNKFNPDFERPSNLLIKLLIGNSNFSKVFMRSLSYINQNTLFNTEVGLEENYLTIKGFIENRGRYGHLAMGFKDYRFPFFVNAFNEMWERNKKEFMDYFDQKFFGLDLNNNGLKRIDNNLVHNLIVSSEFNEFLYKRIESEKYSLETMRGHNTFDLHLQEMILYSTQKVEDIPKHDLFKYLNNMIAISNS